MLILTGHVPSISCDYSSDQTEAASVQIVTTDGR